MSFGIMVHLLACITHKLLSLNMLIKYASLVSCRAIIAVPWNLIPIINCCPISCTRHMKGNFLISSSVLFWYCLISLNASVPGLYLLLGFSAAFLSLGPLTFCWGGVLGLFFPDFDHGKLLSTLLVTFHLATTNRSF